MAEKHVTGGYAEAETSAAKKQDGTKLIQTVSVVVLPFVWVGYFYSFFKGNESNMLSYTNIIVILSLVNSNVLFSRERMQNSILNVLAKLEGVLLAVLALISIVKLIV